MIWTPPPSQKLPLAALLDLDVLAQLSICALYALNEGTGQAAYDATDGGNVCAFGAATAAPVWTASPTGPVLDFDGSNDELVGGTGPGAYESARGLTLAAFVRPEGMGGGSLGRIAGKSGTGAGWLWFLAGTNALRFYFLRSSSAGYRTTANNALTANAWQMVTSTWPGTLTYTDIRHYVNGIEVGYAASGDSSGSGTHTSDAAAVLRVGNSAAGDRCWDGQIGWLAIASRAWTPDEVAATAENPNRYWRPAPARRTFLWGDVAGGPQTLTPAAFAGSFEAGAAALTNANTLSPAAFAGSFAAGDAALTQEATLAPVAYDGGFEAGAATLSTEGEMTPEGFAGAFEAGAAGLTVEAILLPAAFPGGFEAGDASFSWSDNPVRVLDQRLTLLGRFADAPVRVLDSRIILVGKILPPVRVLDQRVILVAAPHRYVLVDARFDTKRFIGEPPLPGGIRLEQAMVDAWGHWQLVPVVNRGRPFRAKLALAGAGTSTFVLTLPPMRNQDGQEVPQSAGWPGRLSLTFQRGSLTHSLSVAVDTYTPLGRLWTVAESNLSTAPLPTVEATGIFYETIGLKLTLPTGAPSETVRLVGAFRDV